MKAPVDFYFDFSSPYGYVAVFDADSARSVGALKRAEQERCGQTEGDGDDGLGVVPLVLVLME